jgi:MFS superfamily sulfate permease-like transporter
MKHFAKIALGACVALVVLAVSRRLFPELNFQVAAALAFIAIVIFIPLYKRVYGGRQEHKEG